MYVLQAGNAVATTNCANEAELWLLKYVSKDFHYGVSNVSHCPAVDDGVEGGIKENKGNRGHVQYLKSYAFVCLDLMCNSNKVSWQITNPKCKIDQKRSLGRFSETQNFYSIAVL